MISSDPDVPVSPLNPCDPPTFELTYTSVDYYGGSITLDGNKIIVESGTIPTGNQAQIIGLTSEIHLASPTNLSLPELTNYTEIMLGECAWEMSFDDETIDWGG